MPPSQIVLLANYLEMYNWQINQIRKFSATLASSSSPSLLLAVLLARIRLETIRIVAPQKKRMDPRKEDEMQTTALEIGLFLAVVLVTLVFVVVFFVVYLINNG